MVTIIVIDVPEIEDSLLQTCLYYSGDKSPCLQACIFVYLIISSVGNILDPCSSFP